MIEALSAMANRANLYVRQRRKEMKCIRKEAPEVLTYLRKELREMQELVVHNEFDSPSDEIRFFKEIKPRLCRHLIYYEYLNRLHVKQPTTTIEDRKTFLEGFLSVIRSYLYDPVCQEAIHYYKAGLTCYDHLFFVRGATQSPECIVPGIFCFERNERFSTHYDYIFAMLAAQSQVEDFIQHEISKLEREKQIECYLASGYSPLRWTDTKISLAEIIYALWKQKSINRGDIDLSDIARVFEHFFNIHLGDIYTAVHKIRERKSGRSLFLTKLKTILGAR